MAVAVKDLALCVLVLESGVVMLPFHTRQVSGSSPTKPQIFSVQSLRLLYSRPVLRWLPYLFALILTLYLFTPFLFGYARDSFPTPALHDGLPAEPAVLSYRAQKIRDAYIHAYSSYKQDAWEWDELKPLSGGKDNK
jgi:mannosyl-oligosaccharide alpha-1,2-mannosidase